MQTIRDKRLIKPTKNWAVEQGRPYFITYIVNHSFGHKQAGKFISKRIPEWIKQYLNLHLIRTKS